MPITIPDASWYKEKSAEANADFSCPYANVHTCHRYYASLCMLGEVKMITSISNEKKATLDAFWENSGLLPVIAEDDTGVSALEGKLSSLSNFCPEVTFTYFGYYASYLAEYVDEIDSDVGHRIANRESIENDWRHKWATVIGCHFLDCRVFNQVDQFNSKRIGKFNQLVHSNVVILIGRMEQCLESNDPAGVLHAAANILETMAKDILGSAKLASQTLGGFIEKYNSKSALPEDIKSVVGSIYKLRNKMPLSGHGSTNAPDIDIRDAIVIAAATKFIVEIEYRTKKI